MTTLAPVPGTGVTKGSIVEMAFEECALAGFEFERTPEEMAMGIRRLSVMMDTYPFRLMGYNKATAGFGQPDEGSNLLAEDVEAVAQHLALRIATAMGKAMPVEYRAAATRGLYALQARYAVIPRQDYRPGTIRGQGGHDIGHRGPFFQIPLPPEDIYDVDPGDLAAISGA